MADDRLNSYANWLVANKDKKGTAEFQKVANAYKQLRGAPQAQPTQQPQQDSSMGTALSIADVQAQAAGAGGMASISRNLENSWLADVQRAGREYVANPIREKLGLDPIDTDAVNRAESERLQKASDIASASADQMIKDTNFKNLTLDDINSLPSFLEYVGQKGAQSLPYMASAMATGGTMTYPFSVGEISSSLKDIEGKTQEEKDNIAATGGAIMTALENLGIASLLPKGVSSSIIGGIASGAITEGFTEGAQELVVIGSEALAGKKFTQEELLTRLKEAAAAGAAVGGSFKGATQAGSKVTSLFKSDGTIADPDTVDGMSAQAAADVARMIRQEAADNGYNLKKVGASDESGSKKALEAVHEKISGRLTALAKDPSVRQLLSPKQAKSLDQLLDDYAAAQTAIRQGKNKVKSKVTQENFDAIKRLLGPTKEGAEILNLLRQSNVVTDLFNNGLKGGLSQFTDYLNPFATSGGAYDPSRTMNVLTGGTSAMTLGPLATAGIVAGGRAVDAVTGRRSVIDRFVRKNEGKRGLGQAEGRSLIEERAQEALDAQLREQEDQNRAAALGALPQSDKDNSPIGSILLGTGVDRDGLRTAMDEIEAIYQDDAVALKALQDVFTDIRKNLDGGTNKIRNLNDVIPIINSHLNTPDTKVQRAARPDQMLAQRGNVNMPTIDQTPPSQPNVMSQAPSFGPQATTQDNYNRGIQDNLNFNRQLQEGAVTDPDLSRVQRGRIITSLENLTSNLGSNPVETAQMEVQKLQEQGVPQEAIDTYVKPYVDRVMQQQASRQFMPKTEGPRGLAAAQEAGVAPTVETQAPTQPEVQTDAPVQPEFDQAINPDIPAPTTVQTAALSAPTPVVHQQIDAPAGQTNHGLLPHLRVQAPTAREGKPLVLAGTNNKNASRQIDGIDEVLARHEDPAASPEAWSSMLGDAMATNDVPVQPHGFIEDLNNGGAQKLLSTLTPGQIADADHGFRNAAEFRQAYINGEIGIEDTGRLFLWSFLSRGVSPYTQEGLFMDSFNGIEEWIRMAAGKSNRGKLEDNIKDYEKWAKSAAPKGSGQPGAGATHNLNAFGNTFLMKMSQDAGKGDGRSRLQVIHDMMSDPNTTGKEVRREFLRMGEGVGIDNKVVSFTLLVAGYDDVMVLDRVQMRQMWNDGRFSGINLYDGYKSDGKPVTGSALSSLTYGARGLLVYEAMEKSLQNRLNQIYTDIGRPDAASVGRYHWETWVASSQQEASHGTIDAILRRAKGDPNPLDGVTAKEGEYGAYAYGARYGVENGVPMFIYEVPGRGEFKFTVPDFQKFLEDIKKPKNKVVPTKFKVTESGNAPWYTREGVNLDALAEKAKEYGKQIRTADAQLRESQTVSDGRTPDAPSGEPALFPALSRTAEGPTSSGDTTGSQSRGPLSLTTLGRIKQAIIRHRPAYQIGKKGGEFENGIQDIQTALELAKAMGITVRMFDSMADLNKEINKKKLPGAGSTAAIFYRGTYLDPFGNAFVAPKAKGFEGLVFALNPGAKKFDGSRINDTQALMYLLHEISHGLTLGNIEGGLQSSAQTFANPITRQNDGVQPGSFAGSALLPLVMKSNRDQRDAILEEISNIQVNLDAFTSNKPEERVAVRNVRRLIKQHDEAKAQGANNEELFAYKEALTDYADYMENIRETAVDPVWIYLMNPSLAKKVMPKTSALIRSEFNKVKDPKIQFFSHPLAVVVAVVAAMLAQREEDDDRERQQQQQMPPGALNQPMAPGMLSAQQA